MKPNIVHRHVTCDRIFVDNNTYKNQMDAMLFSRSVLIRRLTRTLRVEITGSAPLRWLLCSVLCGSSVHVLTIYLTTAVKTNVAMANTLMKLTAAPTRTSLDLFASLTLRRSRKELVIDLT